MFRALALTAVVVVAAGTLLVSNDAALTEAQAVDACQRAVRHQLQHPKSAEFGVYTVSPKKPQDDWVIRGRFLATTLHLNTGVGEYRCEVHPLDGKAVASVWEFKDLPESA